MVAKKKTAAPKKAAPKAAPAAKKKTAKPTKVVAPKVAVPGLDDLDRKGLAARARQLKMELLAIRFNLQSPSLKDYRKKRKELASVLSRLG